MYLAEALGGDTRLWAERMVKGFRSRWYAGDFDYLRIAVTKEAGPQDYYRLNDLANYAEAVQDGFSGLRFESDPMQASKKSPPQVFVGANFSDQGQLSVLSSASSGCHEISSACALQYSNELSAAVRFCSEYEFDFPNWGVVAKSESASRGNLMKLLANKQLEIQSSRGFYGKTWI